MDAPVTDLTEHNPPSPTHGGTYAETPPWLKTEFYGTIHTLVQGLQETA